MKRLNKLMGKKKRMSKGKTSTKRWKVPNKSHRDEEYNN